MPWSLTEEQLAYQETLRDWLTKVADTATVRAWLDDPDHSVFRERFAGDGWSGVGISEDIGGQGGGLVELALTAEELGRSAAPSAAWLAGAVAAPLVGQWSDDALAVLLAPADEPLHATGSRLRLDGDRVTGHVPHVLAASDATRFVVPVDGGLRLVDAGDVDLRPRKLLDRSRASADVALDAAPSAPLDVGDAGVALRETSARMAVLVAADALGAAARMLELAVAYAAQRHQFGVPIGSFQAVKHAAAQILVDVEAARSIVPFAAASLDAPRDERDPLWLLHAGAAKAQVGAAAARTADSALTLHGAIGYTWEHDLQLFYKRAKLDAVLGGDAGVWNDVVADGLALA